MSGTPATFRRTNYSGWLITNRTEILDRLTVEGFAPTHERVVCEHVTYRYPDADAAPETPSARIVAHAAGDGVEALVVEIGGTTTRPDGKTFHVTLSLAEGRKPAEANDAVRFGTVVWLEQPIPLEVAAF